MMNRRVFLLTSVGAALCASSAFATVAPEEQVARSLRGDGFNIVSQRRTLLGRVRFVATRGSTEREVVVDPSSGEILRDYSRASEGNRDNAGTAGDTAGSAGAGTGGGGSNGGGGTTDGGGTGGGGETGGGTTGGGETGGGTTGGGEATGGGSTGGGSATGGEPTKERTRDRTRKTDRVK